MIASCLALDLPVDAFCWQGGEPTLMGVDFFRRVTALQERHQLIEHIDVGVLRPVVPSWLLTGMHPALLPGVFHVLLVCLVQLCVMVLYGGKLHF